MHEAEQVFHFKKESETAFAFQELIYKDMR